MNAPRSSPEPAPRPQPRPGVTVIVMTLEEVADLVEREGRRRKLPLSILEPAVKSLRREARLHRRRAALSGPTRADDTEPQPNRSNKKETIR